jgi:hypothetical protein
MGACSVTAARAEYDYDNALPWYPAAAGNPKKDTDEAADVASIGCTWTATYCFDNWEPVA